MNSPTSVSTSLQPERRARRRILSVAAGLLIMVALGTFLWNVVETSTARVNATTSSGGVFSAGTVELTQPFTVVDVLFDATNLYPGNELVGCIEVQYLGSLPAHVRLHARMLRTTGLDGFVEMSATTPDVANCEEAEAGGASVYQGTLENFWRTHASYQEGLDLGEMRSPETVVLHVVATLRDDNAAQGLTADFALTVEARP